MRYTLIKTKKIKESSFEIYKSLLQYVAEGLLYPLKIETTILTVNEIHFRVLNRVYNLNAFDP